MSKILIHSNLFICLICDIGLLGPIIKMNNMMIKVLMIAKIVVTPVNPVFCTKI
jgi:hypothetical protein